MQASYRQKGEACCPVELLDRRLLAQSQTKAGHKDEIQSLATKSIQESKVLSHGPVDYRQGSPPHKFVEEQQKSKHDHVCGQEGYRKVFGHTCTLDFDYCHNSQSRHHDRQSYIQDAQRHECPSTPTAATAVTRSPERMQKETKNTRDEEMTQAVSNPPKSMESTTHSTHESRTHAGAGAVTFPPVLASSVTLALLFACGLSQSGSPYPGMFRIVALISINSNSRSLRYCVVRKRGNASTNQRCPWSSTSTGRQRAARESEASVENT